MVINMKKLLLMLFIPGISFAGTITTSFSAPGAGTIIFSSGAVSGGSAQTIAFDTISASGFVSGSSPLTWNHTIGSGSNRFLAVGCGTYVADTVTGITVGGNAMTLQHITGMAGQVQAAIYTYINPPSGVQAIAVSASSGISNRVKCGAISWTGVNQSVGVDISTGQINTVGAGVQASTITTTVANDILFDFVSDDNTGETISPSAGQAQQFHDDGSGPTVFGSTMTATTAGNYRMGWSVVNTNSAQSVIAVKPGP